jgi:hypothetical protein
MHSTFEVMHNIFEVMHDIYLSYDAPLTFSKAAAEAEGVGIV